MSDEYEGNKASQIVPNHLGEKQINEKKERLFHLGYDELIKMFNDTKYADWQAEILKRLYDLINKK